MARLVNSCHETLSTPFQSEQQIVQFLAEKQQRKKVKIALLALGRERGRIFMVDIGVTSDGPKRNLSAALKRLGLLRNALRDGTGRKRDPTLE
jgi:hypothetical protein